MKPHWALNVIGKPWTPDGLGPTTFSCWGLVQWACTEVFCVDFPTLVLASAETIPDLHALVAIARNKGWAQVSKTEEREEGDVILMNSIVGRHIGLIIRANGMLGVLHSDGYMQDGRPVG